MRVLIIALFAIIALAFYANNAQSHLCQSTGDPHYKTFSGYPVNLYGDEGDYLLAKDVNNHLQVMTRIRYGLSWQNRGINSAIAIKADRNVVEHFGSFYKINGVKNAKLALKNGAKIAVTGNKWIVTTKSGLATEFNFSKLNNNGNAKFTEYAFNVFVRVPQTYKGKMSGLCGTYNTVAEDKKLWTNFKAFRVEQKSKKNLFDISFKPKKFLKFSKAAWKSVAFKNKAIAFCKKQKLSKRNYNNCLFDIKISGHFKLSKGYAKVKQIKKELKKVAKKNTKKNKVRVFAKCSSMEVAIKKRKEELKNRQKMILRCRKLLKKDKKPTPKPQPQPAPKPKPGVVPTPVPGPGGNDQQLR